MYNTNAMPALVNLLNVTTVFEMFATWLCQWLVVFNLKAKIIIGLMCIAWLENDLTDKLLIPLDIPWFAMLSRQLPGMHLDWYSNFSVWTPQTAPSPGCDCEKLQGFTWVDFWIQWILSFIILYIYIIYCRRCHHPPHHDVFLFLFLLWFAFAFFTLSTHVYACLRMSTCADLSQSKVLMFPFVTFFVLNFLGSLANLTEKHWSPDVSSQTILSVAAFPKMMDHPLHTKFHSSTLC